MTIDASYAQNAYQLWTKNVAAAAAAFESRWTMFALQRVAPELAEALAVQYDQWHTAQFLYRARADGHQELVAQGAAMCRGYAAAVKALIAARVPDDAYVIGHCPRTGTTVAIGEQKAAIERVREISGENVVFLSPDEVASLFGSIEGLKAIAAIKQKFPGAEVIDRHPHEPAKSDAGLEDVSGLEDV